MLIKFKVNHDDNKTTTDKADGDGFQVYALFQFSFTYHVIMWNDPPHPKIHGKSFHPVHATVMSLFFTNIYHCFTMNFFNKDINPIFYLPNIY